MGGQDCVSLFYVWFRELFVFINAATTPSLKYTVNPANEKFNDLISFVREGDSS